MSRYIDYDTWEIIKKNLIENINPVPPVGSVITNSLASFDPNEYYPKTTWMRIKGKVIVGVDENDSSFDTPNETGGSKTHTLDTNEMPSHTHIQDTHNHGGTASAGSHNHSGITNSAGAHTHVFYHNNNDNVSGKKYVSASAYLPTSPEDWIMQSAGGHTHSLSINSGGSHTHSIGESRPTNQNTGGGQAHNNLQPYITKYVWERTA